MVLWIIKRKATTLICKEITLLAVVNMDEVKKQGNPSDPSIGIMAFGFVVVKFSLFVKVSLILGEPNIIQNRGYSAIAGITLVAVGTVTSVLSYIRYKQTEKQLRGGKYNHRYLLRLFCINFFGNCFTDCVFNREYISTGLRHIHSDDKQTAYALQEGISFSTFK